MLESEPVVTQYPQRVCNQLHLAPSGVQPLLFLAGQEVLTL